jgi:hypothetical protein
VSIFLFSDIIFGHYFRTYFRTLFSDILSDIIFGHIFGHYFRTYFRTLFSDIFSDIIFGHIFGHYFGHIFGHYFRTYFRTLFLYKFSDIIFGHYFRTYFRTLFSDIFLGWCDRHTHPSGARCAGAAGRRGVSPPLPSETRWTADPRTGGTLCPRMGTAENATSVRILSPTWTSRAQLANMLMPTCSTGQTTSLLQNVLYTWY